MLLQDHRNARGFVFDWGGKKGWNWEKEQLLSVIGFRMMRKQYFYWKIMIKIGINNFMMLFRKIKEEGVKIVDRWTFPSTEN